MKILEIFRELVPHVTFDNIICLVGLIIFCNWLVKTSFGKKALINSVSRENYIPAYVPFIPFIVWFAAIAAGAAAIKKLTPNLPDWQVALLENALLATAALVAMVPTIYLADTHFTQKLRGFGLNVKTIPADFMAAVVNLISIYPLVVLIFFGTTYFGQLIWGQDFQISRHQELDLLTQYPQLSVRILIILTAVVIVPVFEEMLFRGLFQTMMRSFLARPWLSIVISAALFAVVHADIGHWPALFVLAMCLGYSYEKSNSLLRPIFIHSLFNAASIAATLFGTS